MATIASLVVNIAADVSGFSKNVTKVQRDIRRLGTMATNAGSDMTRYLSVPLAGLGVLSVKTAAEFQTAMAQVKVATKAPAPEMKELSKLATKLGADTIFSAKEAADAMLELAKAGMSPAEIQAGALKATLDLAASSGMDLAESAVVMGAGMNTFNLKAKDSNRIVDALAGAANASSADVYDLSLALQQVGAQADASELSLEETTAGLAALADAGIRGSDAGTSFKVFLQRLIPVSAEAAKTMQKLGISFFDAEGEMLPLEKIAGILQDRLKGLTQEQRLSMMQTMFGADAMRAATILYNQGTEGIHKYIDATSKSGVAAEMAKARMEGIAGAVETLKGSVETAGKSFGDALAPGVIVVAGALTVLANLFTGMPGWAQTAATALAVLVASIGPLLWVIGKAITAYGTWTRLKQLDTVATITNAVANSKLAGVLRTVSGLLLTLAKNAAILAGVFLLVDRQFSIFELTAEKIDKRLKENGESVGWFQRKWMILSESFGTTEGELQGYMKQHHQLGQSLNDIIFPLEQATDAQKESSDATKQAADIAKQAAEGQKIAAEEEELAIKKKVAASLKAYSLEKNALIDLGSQIANSSKEQVEAFQQAGESFYGWIGLFEEVPERVSVSGEALLRNLRDQVSWFSQWQQDIKTLESRIPPEMEAELMKMGPKALDQIQALRDITDEQLSEYVTLWKTKHGQAADAAKLELAAKAPLLIAEGKLMGQGIVEGIAEAMGLTMPEFERRLGIMRTGISGVKTEWEGWSPQAKYLALHDPGYERNRIELLKQSWEGWTPSAKYLALHDPDRYKRYAYGGFATRPSIFGEAGPEMAIPLSPTKRTRAKALYAQTGKMLGMTGTDGGSTVTQTGKMLGMTGKMLGMTGTDGGSTVIQINNYYVYDPADAELAAQRSYRKLLYGGAR